MYERDITQDKLKQLLDYNPETGVFTWVVRKARCIHIGDVAGGNCHGYIRINISGDIYAAHRLACLWMTGDWPADQVDHINHDRSDNRWVNLRQVSQVTNLKNQSLYKNNTCGVTGVYWAENRKKYEASIRVDKKLIHIGRYSLLSDAKAARKAAEIKYGFHQNHGI